MDRCANMEVSYAETQMSTRPFLELNEPFPIDVASSMFRSLIKHVQVFGKHCSIQPAEIVHVLGPEFAKQTSGSNNSDSWLKGNLTKADPALPRNG